jgi:hypothetical protein
MCSGNLFLLCVQLTTGIGVNGGTPVLAHSASRCDDRDLFELLVCAADGRHDGLGRDSQVAGSELNADPTRRPERHHPLLERIELRHEICRPSDSLSLLDNLRWLASVRQPVGHDLQVHPLP